MYFGKWLRVSTAAAIALALLGTKAGTVDAAPVSTAARVVLVGGGYLHCETCESGVGYWDGDVRCFIQFPNPITDCEQATEHSFNGFQCGGTGGGGDLVSSTTPQEDRTPLTLVRRGDGGGGEGGGWCARCGGTSECHQEAQLGGCHVACGGLEATNEALKVLEKSINIADATSARRVFADNPLITWNADRRAIQLRVDCDPTLVHETIPLGEAAALRLDQMLATQ